MSRMLSLWRLLGLLTVALIAVSTARAGPLPIPLAADPCTTEPNTNRGGQDYTHFNSPASPAACRIACENDAQCKAYTYVKPGIQGPTSVCWLKNAVPSAASDTCCTSGVKQAAPPPGPGGADQGDEPLTNRPGKDYTSLNLSSANPGLCKAACQADPQCKAFTYVKPGLQGPQAKCWLKNDVPPPLPDTCCSSGVKAAPPPPGPGGADQGDEPLTNRPGKDYTSLNLSSANPGLCKAACQADPQCKAFTYVKPGLQGPQAKCWLKNDVPPPLPDTCCSSGVKAAPPPPGPGGADQGDEPLTNRPGKDYTSLNLASANPGLCKAACQADPQCKAFTYVKPGLQGPQAKCWLKNDVPPPLPDTCCSSGVKAAPPPPGPGGADLGDEPFTNRPGKDYTNLNLAAADPGLCKAACQADPQCKAFTYVKPGLQGPQAKCWLKNDVPVAKADTCCSSGVKAAPPPPGPGGADLGDEPFTNRPGKDYTNLNLAAADPGLCKAACQADPQCKAFTYVKPGLQGPQAKCWLKNDVPVAKADTCCSSGVKAAPPPPGPGGADLGDEPFTNRPGKDYTNLNLAAADPGLCKAACQADPQCKAFSYVRPGLQGPQAKCWLKNDVPPPLPDTCCSSGVKVVAPLPPPPPPPGPGGADLGDEPFTNRPGQDYTSLTLAAADPGLCKAACQADPQCKAFTYVKPGLPGPQAKCWLKNGVPLALADTCCSSGVKAVVAPPPPPPPPPPGPGNQTQSTEGEQACTVFDPATIQVQQVGDRWKIVQGSTPLFDFGASQANAQLAFDIIQKNGFWQVCSVGQPDSNFMYFVGSAPPGPASTSAEDCITFDPTAAVATQIDGRWKVAVGDMWMLDFAGSADQANQALQVIRDYGLTSQCFVGRPNPSMQYYLVDGAAPSGARPGEDCVAFDPATLQLQQVGGSWKIVDGGNLLLDFADNQANGQLAYDLVQKYGFTNICFVGRPNAPMMYFRR